MGTGLRAAALSPAAPVKASCQGSSRYRTRSSRRARCRAAADIPNAEVAKQLRGVAPPPIATPMDKLPIPLLKLPRGFRAEVYVSGIANARTLRLTERGTLFVSNRVLDKVWAVVDRDGKREAKVIASGLDRPNGLAFHNGTLYIAEGTRITKLEKIEDNLDKPPQPVVVYADLPNTQSHGWRYMAHRAGQQALHQRRRAL